MILHGPTRSHRRPNPALTLIIRPFHRHSQQGVHIELHDPVSPGIDVDVGVVAVRNGQKGAVDVLTGVLAHIRHANQTGAPDYCSRSSRPIPPASHVQVVQRRDSYCRLECGHSNTVVSANCTHRSVVSD